MSALETGLGSAPRVDLAREADFSLGPMHVRPASREVVIRGQVQVLQPRVMQVLVTLARRPGMVVSRDDLVESCWGGLSVSEDAITRCIAALRRLSGQDDPAFSIETVARVGYRLRPPPTAAASANGTPADRSGPQAAIAVLPFVNMSPEPVQEFFSDGLSEELMSKLAQLEGLRVTGRTSSFAFKNRNEDLRAIGEQLGVAHILEGSVRKDGERLRITARLLSAEDGYLLWSETFDRRLDDVFSIQEEIARSVAAALSVSLGILDAGAPARRTDDVEIYNLYLRGLSLGRKATSSRDFIHAADVHRAVIALDPSFTRARLDLVYAYYCISVVFPERAEECLREMEVVVGDACEHAPDDPCTHYSRAILHVHRHEWAAAEAALTRAHAGSNGALWAVRSVPYAGVLLCSVGRVSEAIELFRQGVRIDPFEYDVSNWLQQALTAAGRLDEAETEYRRAADLRLAGVECIAHMALLRAWNMDDDALVHERFKAHIDHQSIATPLPAALWKVYDNPAAALALVRAAADDPRHQDGMRQVFIGLYAAHYGDGELALAALRRSLVEKKTALVQALWYPDMAAIRREPGFKDLVRDLGLADYWRATGKWGDFARPVEDADFECI